MVLLSLIGAAVAYCTVKGTCEAIGKYGQNAYKGIDTRDFDLKNSANGIRYSSETDINKIAARNGIRCDKYGLLPEFGYRNCLEYVRRYSNSENDVDGFIRSWKRTVRNQEARRSSRLKAESVSSYESNVKAWREADWDNRRTIIIELSHWWGLTIEDHQERAMDIYNNTYMGEIAVKKPVVRRDPKIYGRRIETWQIRARKDFRQDEWSTNNRIKAMYTLCAKQRGLEAKL